MNVLLFTSYWPPDQHIAAHRWDRLGKYLARDGFKFLVIAADHTWEGVLATGTPSFSPMTLTRVPYSRSVLPYLYPRIRKVKASKPATQPVRSVSNEQRHRPGRIKALVWNLVHWCDFPDFSYRWGKAACKEAGKRALEFKPDVVVGTHPYVGCLRAASLFSAQFGVPWIADMRDPFAEDPQSHYNRRKFSRRALYRIERSLLSSASYTVTINPQLARLLQAEERFVRIIPNSFDPEEREADARVQRDGAIVRILYAGNVLPDHRFEEFVRALGRAEDVLLRQKVQFHYYGRAFDRLSGVAQSVGLRPGILVNNGVVPPKQAEQEMRSADLLLAFGWKGRNQECVMTGKVFDYLGSGVPILAIDRTENALGGLVSETGAGLVENDDAKLAELLTRLAENPDVFLTALKARRNAQKVKEYSTPFTAARYGELMRSVRK